VTVASGDLNGHERPQESLPSRLLRDGSQPAGHRPSLASTEIGGRVYALRRVASCLTCSSDYREEIEAAFVKGYTPKTIVRSLPDDANLTQRNIREHFLRQHLPLDDAVVARLVEEECQHRDEVVSTGADSAMRTLGLSFLVRDEVERRLEAGELAVSVKDGLAAEALITRYEMATRTAMDQETMLAGMAAFVLAVKEHCTREQAMAIKASIQTSADARALQDWTGTADLDD
jgi:hypothetical protein